MITSPHNEKLKLIRKLHDRKHRSREGLFVAEGEDLVAAAARAGVEPEVMLVAGEDVEPRLLDAVSTLGSGTRAIGVYRQRWSEPVGPVCVYLHEVGDPGNVGAVIRTAHALVEGAVALGPGCADPTRRTPFARRWGRYSPSRWLARSSPRRRRRASP